MQSAKSKIDILRKELEFLECGGYRSMLGWRPPLVFEDSPTCPKPPNMACPDARCVLIDFVPDLQRVQEVPCRHIPLSEAGETLHTLYNTATMEEIENALRAWLKREIAKLERSQAAPPHQAA